MDEDLLSISTDLHFHRPGGISATHLSGLQQYLAPILNVERAASGLKTQNQIVDVGVPDYLFRSPPCMANGVDAGNLNDWRMPRTQMKMKIGIDAGALNFKDVSAYDLTPKLHIVYA
jgi:hypothetical protein